ncbi:RagB/SusD family nutrient uptake outer membrane protein [Hymenobacter sp. 15J16-1T3B]|uniref:RagB/SusD family nutrient uptake outer membrane protein n=1 Tax=Hymenobacter sp. 15J16-1T3B TaxID=2886941 RepID=UPI001D11F3F0|nr:RagB/SusD family nutrient uptake outer membrane protein [Hymenobacter sp. 15J16-1T3B]MCC3157292.1 RagB/SusD family nutrient uptake outer membrane protein [Hymenobacter sp. 15J16-1T3B]
MKSIVSLTGRAALLALLLAGATGCDLLDQQSPQDFNPDDVFSSPTRVDKAAAGMYDALQDGSFLGSFALIYSDVRSDDLDLAGGFQTVSTSNMPSSDGAALGAWAGGYRSMYMANYIIRELTKRNGAGISAESYNQYIGEAKFIRALCHFTLVNLFAQPYNYTGDGSHLGVPIQLEAPDGTEAYLPEQQKSRATVKQVYDQVILDLTEAIAGLPEEQGQGNLNVARATKDAARGLLSRVYLYKGDYVNAARYAGEIISSGRHQLNTSAYGDFKVPAGGEPTFTSESIFFIAMSQNDNPNTNAAIGQFYAPGSGLTVTPYAKALPGPVNATTGLPTTTGSTAVNTDRRRSELLVFRLSKWATRKYTGELASGQAGGSNRGAWIPIVRYPEILLNQAEALVKQSSGMPTDTVALHYLNMVRDRSKPLNAPHYRLSSFSSKEAFIDAILTERRFELAFEGHRLYDLFRNGRNVPAHGTTTPVPELRWKDPKSIFPIPASELQRNPNLVQNEGY